MDFTNLNFVRTCETTTSASSTIETCYDPFISLLGILIPIALFLAAFFFYARLFSGNILASSFYSSK